jgi:hypothetical protein
MAPLVLDAQLFLDHDKVMINSGKRNFGKLEPLPSVICLCGSY